MMKERLPYWFRKKISKEDNNIVQKTLNTLGLNSVCESAKCPNKMECFASKTATFLLLGTHCSRRCKFCNIGLQNNKEKSFSFDEELTNIIKAIDYLKLEYVVLTMVSRDDLIDGGSSHIYNIVNNIKNNFNNINVEVLTSDFKGDKKSLDKMIQSKVDVFAHNIETVNRISEKVRSHASYSRSLNVLNYISKNSDIIVKSGLMVGLGETFEEIFQALEDLKNNGCQIVSIGQYLQPHKKLLNVEKYFSPEEFKTIENFGENIGLKMCCGPLVRSSYKAKYFKELLCKK